MIEIVPPAAYPAYADELIEMHRLRYRVFKERLNWNVRTEGGLERDEFDDLSPTYILALDDQGLVAGSWRLLPTTGPTMLADVFPQLLDGQPMPTASHIWECSRFALDATAGRRQCLASLNKLTAEMFCGLIEFCLVEDIREVITAYDILIARMLPRVGCLPKWQGQRHRIGNTIAVAGWFDATPELLDQVQRTTGITESVINPRHWPQSQPIESPVPESVYA